MLGKYNCLFRPGVQFFSPVIFKKAISQSACGNYYFYELQYCMSIHVDLFELKLANNPVLERLFYYAIFTSLNTERNEARCSFSVSYGLQRL